MTPYQIEMCAYTLAWLNLNEQVPLQLSDDPARAGLSYHAIFGGHPNCPGTPMIAQRQAIVDRAQELAASTVKYALQWPT